MPARIATALAPADPETLPECSAAAASHLQRMLGGDFSDALPQWLRALALADLRVPHRCLSDLLDLASRRRDLRPLLRGVIGQRGLWLMRQNPDWQFDAVEDDAITWETGSRDARIAAFGRMRQSNPELARQRLEKAWQQEPPEDRVQLLAQLATSLSMADETFLEAALDDRRKEVRKAAAELLMCLPASRLVVRMKGRVAASVKVNISEKRKLLGLGAAAQVVSIDIELPAACDKAMSRDGIEAKPPAGTGERAWWLQQIVASVPPSILQTNSVLPMAVIQAAQKTEWVEPLYRGWSRAAARCRDARWAAALLPWHMGSPENQQDGELIGQLAGALSSSDRESAALGALETYKLSLVAPATRAMLSACDPWSAQLTRGVIEAIAAASRGDLSWAYQFREVAPQYSLRMDPALAADLSAISPAGERGVWSSTMESMIAMVQFRKEMLEAIKAQRKESTT